MEQTAMSGQFEVFSSPDGGYRFRLVDSSGTTWATSSETFATKRAVAAAIALVREIAGTGLVRDQSTGHSGEQMQPRFRATQAAAIRNGSSNFLSGAGLSRLSGHSSVRAHM
ncbi:YegP family protein [Arthrobacter sp. AFG20]|uniref:YegP family protein n=1 Tax=Arthrobacter sp. AFG20 TaxID=1688671 RepID=UPI0026B5876E|nr:YegP family protein [Arthrobacter sp. AFG20]